MARADGYETLMLRVEAKKAFYECKKQVEALVDIPMTNSQAMQYLCKLALKQIPSDGIKGE